MTEEEVRSRASELLSQLMQLESLATSDSQRRDFKESRESLKLAIDSGSEAKLRVGAYWLAAVSGHVRMVQEGKRKGEMRAKRRAIEGSDHA